MGSQIEGNIVFLFVISEILMITLYLILKKFPEGFRLPGYFEMLYSTQHLQYALQ